MSRDPFADVPPCPHALPLPFVVACTCEDDPTCGNCDDTGTCAACGNSDAPKPRACEGCDGFGRCNCGARDRLDAAWQADPDAGLRWTPGHRPSCPWFDAAHDGADHGPATCGSCGNTGVVGEGLDREPCGDCDMAASLAVILNGPADPDRPWAFRDSGD